jgi:hypothetical protein
MRLWSCLVDTSGLWLVWSHGTTLLVRLPDNTSYALQASSNGGTTVVRRPTGDESNARLTSTAAASGNADHSSAAAPVTNGAAMLVPAETAGSPSGGEAGNTLTRCTKAPAANRAAQVRRLKRPPGGVTGDDWDDPRMHQVVDEANDDRVADVQPERRPGNRAVVRQRMHRAAGTHVDVSLVDNSLVSTISASIKFSSMTSGTT